MSNVEQVLNSDIDDEITDVFYLGSCTVTDGLRMEDVSKSKAVGDDVILGIFTSTKRPLAATSCAICYYDSAEDEQDDKLESEFTKKTTQPVGRYGALCHVNVNNNDNVDTSIEICKVCSHSFHTVCLYNWIKTDTGGFTCPICRGGLQKQHLDGIPPLFSVAPDYVVKMWDNPAGGMKKEYFELAGVRDGVYKKYYRDGYLELERTYVAGQKHGRENAYYDDPNRLIKSEVDFVDDKKHGLIRLYTSTGVLFCENGYNNGLKSGLHIKWFTDVVPPRPVTIEHFKNGKRHGLFLTWSFAGQLLLHGNYIDDEKDGRFCAWYERNYGLKIKEFFVMGVKHGKSAEYYEPDNKIYAGQLRPKEVGYYEHGMRVGIWRSYWSNGQMKSEAEYNTLGQRDGVSYEWNRMGRKYKVFRFENDEVDGVCETYDETSMSLLPSESATYRNGKLHGLYVSRYKNDGKTKLVKIFRHQQEILMRWYSKSGELLSEYKVDDPVPVKVPENNVDVDVAGVEQRRRTKEHPDIVHVQTRGNLPVRAVKTRFVG